MQTWTHHLSIECVNWRTQSVQIDRKSQVTYIGMKSRMYSCSCVAYECALCMEMAHEYTLNSNILHQYIQSFWVHTFETKTLQLQTKWPTQSKNIEYIDVYKKRKQNWFDYNRQLKTKARQPKFNLINKISMSS